MNYWKLHILILMVKIWFPFSYHVPGTNPNVAACLTPSTYDLFAKSLPFLGVANLIKYLLDILKSADIGFQ